MFSTRYLQGGLLLAAVVGTTSACASQGALYRYPIAARGVDQRAYSVGYNEGLRRGEQDARRRRSFDYARHDDYRDGDNGYHGYGDRNGYRGLYRQGFVAGYNDGYRRYARGSFGNVRGRYASPAAQNGYRDGFAQGRDDARDGDRYDPVRASRYRSGDRDYDRRYGSRNDYQREYRAAFQAGYDDGFRGSRRF